LGDLILLLLLFLAVIYDQREQRIPNVLAFTGLILGIIWNIYIGGLPGAILSIKGLALGIGLLFIPFALGGMGAGDVKLLGVVGAFKGGLFAFQTFIAMALWGGLIAITLLIKRRQLGKTLGRLWALLLLHLFKVIKMQDAIKSHNTGVCFPYALAIALGAMSAYLIKW
jgi:prepilin peptidase CpaA